MNFIISNLDNFQRNSSIHSINTRNKHHLHRPNANLSCFQKSTFYPGIKIFNILPPSLTNLKNDITKYKAALRIYINTHSFHSVHESLKCTDDLQHSFVKCLKNSTLQKLSVFVGL